MAQSLKYNILNTLLLTHKMGRHTLKVFDKLENASIRNGFATNLLDTPKIQALQHTWEIIRHAAKERIRVVIS